jgi:FKBP-type peptidyl-prolyl cis-trans isomerase SlyD
MRGTPPLSIKDPTDRNSPSEVWRAVQRSGTPIVDKIPKIIEVSFPLDIFIIMFNKTRRPTVQISDNTVVSFDYTLKNDDGQILDSSQEREPLTFIHGTGAIIPGLEEALAGREEGESFSLSLKPDQAYGEYNENLIFDVPKTQFQDPSSIAVGTQVQAQMQDGSKQVLMIKEVGDEKVTLDANHPLAGENLHFDIEVKEVREATSKELDENKDEDKEENSG